MIVDEAIDALRGDHAAQRRIQSGIKQCLQEWEAGAAAGVLADLRRYGEGDELADCAALSRLTNSLSEGRRLMASLFDPAIANLSRHWLGQVPLRHQYSDGIGLLQLSQAGRASLSLVFYEERATRLPNSVCFTDGEVHEIVLAGRGVVQMVEAGKVADRQASLNIRTRTLTPGTSYSLSCSSQAKQVIDTDGSLVLLRLGRTGIDAKDTCEYRLDDGKLIHRASGNRRDSRFELMIELLGAMEHGDAAPVLADMALAGSERLRWQALRHSLALDTRRGFASLVAIATDKRDPLSSAAEALQSQLLAAHPQLRELERLPCPA